MKTQVIIAFSLVLLAFSLSFAEDEMPQTPYGDFCPACSKYGICKKFLSLEESREAVKSYFSDKGINVGRMKGKGRFLKIELLKNKELLDVILFDRKTGRIRSIY